MSNAVRIATRAELGSRPFRTTPTHVPLSQRLWWVTHYWGAGTPPRDLRSLRKAIERIHMDSNGWRSAGYNLIVDAYGAVGEGCGRDVIGSHSPPHNRDGIGVFLWTDRGVPTDATLAAARGLYDQLNAQKGGAALRKGWHGMDYGTECPGPDLRAWTKAGMPYPGGYSPLPDRPGGNGDTATPRPTPIDPEEIDMATAKELEDKIDALGRVLEARTNPNVPGDQLPGLVSDVRLLKARTAPIPGMDLQVGMHRTKYTYATVLGLAREVAALGQKLAAVGGTADEVRQVLNEAGAKLERAAKELQEEGN